MKRLTTLTIAAVPLGLLAPLLVAPPAQAAGLTHISFEDAPQKCLFNQTTALRDRYAAASFRGKGALKGGGILSSTCGGWAQSAHNGDQFLAFNEAATYSDGGDPVGPQRIKFPTHKKMVSIWVSQANDGGSATFTLVGKKGPKTVRKHTVTVNDKSWVRLKVRRKKGMNKVVVRAQDPDNTWLLDDLRMRDK